MNSDTVPARPFPAAAVVTTLVVPAASLVLGGATSYGQGLLPEVVQPFANSASGWTVLTALLVWSARRGLWASAVLGSASFVALVLGYTVVSNARGFSFDPLFWCAVGVVAGPLIGAAAAALHQSDRRVVAVGGGLLAGVLLGESYYGLTMMAATTGRGYWILAGVLGVALLAAVAARRLRTLPTVLLMSAVTIVVAGLFNLAYVVLDTILGSRAGGA